ncbi:b(o/a)3-type cytochrome-c oxidase subunit 1 [Fodinisporobacter ferrooxydans]|uniref:B(O/a)3-type cytochrome-c oxidase subunit 1 n=1 Tax=Fodinisporobacter ferrooxydans TaxID=2901836 RepID=A0ABY4CQM5_9BACL|nr:b(o/a)3-type cytochrome-c oxidase subunit 1 [Alicyclobacillaceae bacterium MYW30-H2]
MTQDNSILARFDKKDASLSLAYVVIAFLAIFIGAIAGLLQGLDRGHLITLPSTLYYEILTAHGVMMGVIFTTFFIIGFLFAGTARTVGGLTNLSRSLGWIGYWMMVIGTALGTAEILAGNASVLYTFYAPLKASPFFYIALTLIVVGSWLGGYGIFASFVNWRRNHKGQTTPLFAYMATATMALWQIATLGVAAEVLFQLIPWSFGWVPTIDVLLSRTLFWFFGHPLVYFWLLPAYACWYVNIPKIIGTKLFSNALPRVTFMLFLLLSTPVGFHHQLLEPGIPPSWKALHVALTMGVVIPSLMTAFALFATFEIRGRERGAKSLFGWFSSLPYSDVRFFGPFMGMLMFIPAGIGGIINASFQLDEVVHNTLWVTGHFHITVGAAVALTFFGTAYWLIPALNGRVLTPRMNKMGLLQVFLWVVGMTFMSVSMHTLGLLGEPRRTAFTNYLNSPVVQEWAGMRLTLAIGGIILFISAMILTANIVNLLFFAPKGETEFPVAEEAAATPESVPPILERWGVWLSIAVVLVLIAYTMPVYDQIQLHPPGSKGFVTW